MALYNIASDLNTRQTVWVSTNVAKGRPQLNSEGNAGRSLNRAGIDGFPAWEIAGLHCNFVPRAIRS
jgi:hypothetical protein